MTKQWWITAGRIVSAAPVVAATTVGLGLFAAGCSRTQSDDRIEEAQARVTAQAILVSGADVTTVVRERLEGGITLTGELAPVDVVIVGARFDGDLETVSVREGDPVRKGQSMAAFLPRDVRNTLQAAEAELLAAKAARVSAENGARRAQKLLEAGAAAPSDREAAEAAHTAAEARVRAAQAQFELAKDNADKLTVPSPIHGWVSRVSVHVGDHVVSGDPLFTVVRRDLLELSATIPSEALGRARLGSPINLKVDAFPGELFEGTLDRINPTTEPGTRQIRVYTRVPNPDGRLVGGLFASGRIVDSVREQAVTAPVKVLRREGADQVVYRLKNGTAERLVVETGLLDEERGRVELLGSLEAGDSLLTGVVPGLRPGAPVRVIQNGGESAPATSVPKP